MAKTWAKSEPLVAAHIKGVSVDAIERHLDTFREFIGHGKSGIYVLRKNRDVYYVGLASSLRKRLADHLKDHHQGKWDWFDLYIIQKNGSEQESVKVCNWRGFQNPGLSGFIKDRFATMGRWYGDLI